ncbi:MAG: response regulator transcription factor [Bacteroidales bacterium]|jgi:DNA-binding NarL/FixJ family response regulator|nr:response regulator transcription factor [Bacteroidales bacterium]
MEKIKVFIADDHQLFRDGIKYILSESERFITIGEASNGKELLEKLERIEPDIILLDINMPVMNGIEAAKEILAKNPNQAILVLSMYDSEEYYNAFIDLGVKGFLLKDSSNHELMSAMDKILKGDSYFSQELLMKIIKNKDEAKDLHLTPRELDVLELICKGFSNFEISEKLFISQRTVERHRANLLEKTESSNSIKLVLFAIKNNIVHLD